MGIYVNVKGSDEIIKELRQVQGEAKETVIQVLKEETGEIVKDARSRAPKDTGALARGIKRSVSRKKLEARVSAGGMVGGVDTYYAQFVEFGTKDVPAQPFLYPAARAREPEIYERLTEAMYDLIREGGHGL
jgi:HK97 gp10 family phage protein